MPIYEYECTSCGHRFEKMVKIGAEAPPCPECAANVRKLISQSAFILKGGGWYKDHYGLKGESGSSDSAKVEGSSKKEGSSPKAETSTSSESTSTKTEAAPAAAKTEAPKAAPAVTPSTAAK